MDKGGGSEAEKWLLKSLEISKRIGDEHEAAMAYQLLGLWSLFREDGSKAGFYWQRQWRASLRRKILSGLKSSHKASW